MLEKILNRVLGAIFMWLWAMLAGCTLHHVIDFGNPAPDPAVVQWQQDITKRVNELTDRVKTLEEKETPNGI